jgi:hypothetical protein
VVCNSSPSQHQQICFHYIPSCKIELITYGKLWQALPNKLRRTELPLLEQAVAEARSLPAQIVILSLKAACSGRWVRALQSQLRQRSCRRLISSTKRVLFWLGAIVTFPAYLPRPATSFRHAYTLPRQADAARSVCPRIYSAFLSARFAWSSVPSFAAK